MSQIQKTKCLGEDMVLVLFKRIGKATAMVLAPVVIGVTAFSHNLNAAINLPQCAALTAWAQSVDRRSPRWELTPRVKVSQLFSDELSRKTFGDPARNWSEQDIRALQKKLNACIQDARRARDRDARSSLQAARGEANRLVAGIRSKRRAERRTQSQRTTSRQTGRERGAPTRRPQREARLSRAEAAQKSLLEKIAAVESSKEGLKTLRRLREGPDMRRLYAHEQKEVRAAMVAKAAKIVPPLIEEEIAKIAQFPEDLEGLAALSAHRQSVYREIGVHKHNSMQPYDLAFLPRHRSIAAKALPEFKTYLAGLPLNNAGYSQASRAVYGFEPRGFRAPQTPHLDPYRDAAIQRAKVINAALRRGKGVSSVSLPAMQIYGVRLGMKVGKAEVALGRSGFRVEKSTKMGMARIHEVFARASKSRHDRVQLAQKRFTVTGIRLTTTYFGAFQLERIQRSLLRRFGKPLENRRNRIKWVEKDTSLTAEMKPGKKQGGVVTMSLTRKGIKFRKVEGLSEAKPPHDPCPALMKKPQSQLSVEDKMILTGCLMRMRPPR